jgi:hypothetical protein
MEFCRTILGPAARANHFIVLYNSTKSWKVLTDNPEPWKVLSDNAKP